MITLPKELQNPKNADFWEWDGWKPKAKANAPEKVKKAIEKWLADIEEAENSGADDEIVSI